MEIVSKRGRSKVVSKDSSEARGRSKSLVWIGNVRTRGLVYFNSNCIRSCSWSLDRHQLFESLFLDAYDAIFGAISWLLECLVLDSKGDSRRLKVIAFKKYKFINSSRYQVSFFKTTCRNKQVRVLRKTQKNC